MKIIIPNLPIYILHYIAQCLESTKSDQCNILLWNTNRTSIIDMFDETHPDIVFIHTSHLDQAFIAICQEFNFQYVLIVTEGNVPTNLPKSPSAILDLPPQNISKEISNNTIRPKPMANIPDIHNARYVNNFKSTLLIDTTSAIINNDILGLLSYLTSMYSTKIVGDQPVPLHNYLGKVDMINRANLIKSSEIVIDIGTVGNYWNAAYLKVPSISIHPTNSIILYCKDLSALKQHLNTLLNQELIRTKYIDESYREACNNTSFLFTAELFNIMGESQISQTLLRTQEDLI